MKTTSYFIGLLTCTTLLIAACKKEPGSGGNSAISGNVSGKIINSSGGNQAESEVTHVTIPDGSDIEDGEYILLNTPNNGTYYYVWFKWNNGVQPDPALAGRTGIQVTFDFTESNTTVATNTANAITAAVGGDFTVAVNSDILTLTNNSTGEVPDAEEFTQNISLDVANQGQSAISGGTSFVEGPIVDERVYLVYGEEDFYSESVRTDADGNYQFKGLNKGNYRIYTFSIDTLDPNGSLKQVEISAEITENKQVVQAPELYVVQ